MFWKITINSQQKTTLNPQGGTYEGYCFFHYNILIRKTDEFHVGNTL